jgi:hypothetical protein
MRGCGVCDATLTLRDVRYKPPGTKATAHLCNHFAEDYTCCCYIFLRRHRRSHLSESPRRLVGIRDRRVCIFQAHHSSPRALRNYNLHGTYYLSTSQHDPSQLQTATKVRIPSFFRCARTACSSSPFSYSDSLGKAACRVTEGDAGPGPNCTPWSRVQKYLF